MGVSVFSIFCGETEAVALKYDEVLFVECANGPFEGLFAHLEHALNVFSVAFVAQWALTSVVLEPLQQRLGEVFRLAPAGGLQGDVELAVGTHLGHVAFQPVATVDVLENLVLIDEPAEFVVDDDLESEIGFLPNEQVHLVVGLVGWRVV